MKAVVKKVEQAAPDAVAIYFDNFLTEYLPGQHIQVQAEVDNEIISRNYSLFTSPVEDEEIGIAVRAVPEGKMSNYLVKHLRKKMILDVSAPAGEFTLQPYQKGSGSLVFFAAGSGITPIFSMIKTALITAPDMVVYLFYSNRDFNHIIFKNELKQLEEKYSGRLTVFHILNDIAGAPEDFPVVFEGLLNRLLIRKYIRQVKENRVGEIQCYLCGPFAYMQLIEESLLSLEISLDKIFKEHFFIPPNEVEFDESILQDRNVLLIINNGTAEIAVEKGNSILMAALHQGLSMPYSCTMGQCGLCRAKLISGEVKMKYNAILTETEQAEGQILLCQSFPLSDDVIISQS